MSSRAPSFPWTESPLIANAPMGGIALSKLAIAVSSAGGLGFIGTVNDMKSVSDGLEAVYQYFSTNSNFNFDAASLPTLPIGIGFLLFTLDLKAALNVLRNAKKPPAVVWLFASPEPDPIGTYANWTSAMRKEFPNTQVWIQVGGSVSAIIDTINRAKPDVVVVQGNDAGGHGSETGASLFSLLPETIDTLRSKNISIPIVASGGIVDARGAAAAFMLGASGVVLGTRFLASEEVSLPHPEYQKRIIDASDGAANTIRAKVFDELKGPNLWPTPYDGRALVSASYKDWKAGATPNEIIERMKTETDRGEEGDMGFGTSSDRAAIWAGSAVGLVKEVMPASKIVAEIRQGIPNVIHGLKHRL